jgi:hypothetical protein
MPVTIQKVWRDYGIVISINGIHSHAAIVPSDKQENGEERSKTFLGSSFLLSPVDLLVWMQRDSGRP